MSGFISPAARAARKVAASAVESPASAYGTVDAIVFALDAAQLLQSPELATELARLRGLSYAAPYVWQVWDEDGPLYGMYASQQDAEQGTVDCYRAMGESCPDYSWKWDSAGTGELLAGDEPVGIYLGRVPVRGQQAPAAAPQPEPDFFQPDRAYTRGRWTFHCLAVAPTPTTGLVCALGFLTRTDGTCTVHALDQDDWEHEGWLQTEGSEGHG